MHGYDPASPPVWMHTASHADRDKERERRLRMRLVGQNGRPPAFRTAGVWQSLDPEGGELALKSPERKLRPARLPVVTRPRGSMLNPASDQRLAHVFSLASRQDARAESHARLNVKNKLHVNRIQPTIAQIWNRGAPTR